MKVKSIVSVLNEDVKYEIIYNDEFVKDVDKSKEKILNSEVYKIDIINDILVIQSK